MSDSNEDLFCFDKPANLCWIAGNDETVRITWKDKDTGTPIDITGATAEMQLRKGIYDAADLTLAGAVTGGSGQIDFTATDVQTDGLITDEGQVDYIWDCRLTLASGDKKTIAGGSLTVKEGVTK